MHLVNNFSLFFYFINRFASRINKLILHYPILKISSIEIKLKIVDFNNEIWYYVYRWRKLHKIKKEHLILSWVWPLVLIATKSCWLGGRFYFTSCTTSWSKIIMISENISISFLNITITSLSKSNPPKKIGLTHIKYSLNSLY